MKSNYRKLGLVFVIFFVIGIFASSYLLYALPAQLGESRVLDYTKIDLAKGVFNQINIIIGIELFVGITAMILLVISDKSETSENVVYIETFKKEKEKSSRASSEEEEVSEKKFGDVLEECLTLLSKESDPKKASEKVFSILATKIEICQAAYYVAKSEEGKNILELVGSYAFVLPESRKLIFEFGEGVAGQVAVEAKKINLETVPDGYIKILSGLGSASPSNLLIIPSLVDNKVVGVAELASFKKFKAKEEALLTEIFNELGSKVKVE